MRKHALGAALAASVISCALAACGGSGYGPPAGHPDLAGAVQGCGPADFVDHTADTGPVAVTPWDLSSTAPRCVKIGVGQTVTWASSSTHPLIAMGGDPGTPIPTTATTSAASITFPNAGTFGFWCNVHTTQMEGAIEVLAAK